jgi:hypothetical protein
MWIQSQNCGVFVWCEIVYKTCRVDMWCEVIAKKCKVLISCEMKAESVEEMCDVKWKQKIYGSYVMWSENQKV